MGKTLWGMVSGRCQLDETWRAFAGHYSACVYATFLKHFRDPGTAGAFTEWLFASARTRLLDTKKEQLTLTGGSLSGYLWTVARNMVETHRTHMALGYLPPATDAQLAALATETFRDDLASEVELRDFMDVNLGRLRGLYNSAVAALPRQQQYHPASFALFLRIYRDGTPAAEIEREMNLCRGAASQTAGNICERLCRLMGLPFNSTEERGRARTVIRWVLEHSDDAPE